ncbi:VWA domain-containing protein [Arachnia propionica]|uniref:VWA domain-containing protein n=1 Tax=Arachnia propionica TaxID=1750 RepID=A0A3P1T4J5_9ACTN|nr:VWA domain-containing protein [Arachnia propionica]RRD04437.1 VWA domain-containing protein [Arachnia propionica]
MKTKALTLFLLALLAMTVLAPQKVAFADEQPLVIVFDVSGSMAEQDSSGTVKLETAKRAMADLVQGRKGLPVGLWTYPGGASEDGCMPGGWVENLSPQEHPDVTDVTAQIQLLTANGDTPTGPALKNVADSLKDQGYDKATIVLVSDGKANCGPPPCEVAQEVVNSGFDLTVAAVAFDIEEGGQGELQCIANVTGGTYADAKEAGELAKELEALQPAKLKLTVAAPEIVQAGELIHFRVSIHNPGSESVSDASLLLSMSDSTLVPFVPAPHKRLEAIPPGKTVTKLWTVGTRSGLTGSVDWAVLAGSRRLGAVSEKGTVKLTNDPLKRSDGGAVLAERTGSPVVLGDSYSSGEGAGDYLPEEEGMVCHRSKNAYGKALDDDTTILACSGATRYEMTGFIRHEKQPNQIGLLAGEGVPDMVLLTIGGNDIGFADIVLQCFLADCANNGAEFKEYSRRIQSLPGYAKTYQEISKMINSPEMVSARGGVYAPIIVSPYPNPLWDKSRGKCNGAQWWEGELAELEQLVSWEKLSSMDWVDSSKIGFSRDEIAASELILGALNAKIERSVKEAADAGYPVFYADSVRDFAVGHSICEADSYFVRLTVTDAGWRGLSDFMTKAKQEMFHPNKEGHRAWANRLITWSQRVPVNPDVELPKEEPESLTDRLIRMVQQPVIVNSVILDPILFPPKESGELVVSETVVPVTTTGEVTVRLTGLMPGTNVRITVESESQLLASPQVDEDGTIEATVTLPELSAGQHHLVLEGYDETYALVGLRVPLRVDSGVPIWVLVLTVVGVLGLLGTGVMMMKRRKLRATGSSLMPMSESSEPTAGDDDPDLSEEGK